MSDATIQSGEKVWEAGARFADLRLAIVQADACLKMYAGSRGKWFDKLDEAMAILDSANQPFINAFKEVRVRTCIECGTRIKTKNPKAEHCGPCGSSFGADKGHATSKKLKLVNEFLEEHAGEPYIDMLAERLKAID